MKVQVIGKANSAKIDNYFHNQLASFTYLKNVALETFKVLQISSIERLLLSCILRAVIIFGSSDFKGGRPPTLPLARAEANPARVLS